MSELRLFTGLDSDARKPLERGHALFDLARHAWLHQDGWSAAEHRSFWAATINLWPYPERQRQRREVQGWAAWVLAREGLTVDEIADVLHLAPDTIRRRDLVGIGEDLYRLQVERPPQLASEIGPLAPLPRVYADDEEEPPFTWVNLPLGAARRPREIRDIEFRLHQALAERRRSWFDDEAA